MSHRQYFQAGSGAQAPFPPGAPRHEKKGGTTKKKRKRAKTSAGQASAASAAPAAPAQPPSTAPSRQQVPSATTHRHGRHHPETSVVGPAPGGVPSQHGTMAHFHRLNQQEHGILQHSTNGNPGGILARSEAHMSGADVRVTAMETRIENLETRMSGVEGHLAELKRTLKQHITKQDLRYETLHCSAAYANRATGMNRTRSISKSKEHNPDMPIVSL